MGLFKAEGVGTIGRAFLTLIHPAPEKQSWFGPASSWTQRKPSHTPDGAYAPKIKRRHAPWPGGSPQGQHQPWPRQSWPGGPRAGR